MALLKSKRLKELEIENEELRNNLKRINDKEEKVRQLEEAQRRLRAELTEINQTKSRHTEELDNIIIKEKESKSALEKYTDELKRIQEMKTQEQNDLLTLTSKLESIKNNFKELNPDLDINDLLNLQINEEISEAEKAKDLLIGENIKLEETARELTERINQLKQEEELLLSTTLQLKNDEIEFDHVLDKSVDEELNQIESEFTELKENSKLKLEKIQNRIEHLRNEEAAITDRIEIRKKELEEIENSTIQESSVYKKETEENMISLIVEEQKLVESIENKNKAIAELTNRLNQLKTAETNATNQIKKRFETLKSKEIELRGNINLLQLQLKEKTESLNDTREIDSKIAGLKEYEQNLNDKISQLTETENYKQATLNELNDKISAKELEFKALSQDFDKSANQLNEIFIKKEKMTDEVSHKQKELLAIVQSLNNKNESLKSLRGNVDEYQERVNQLKSEIDKYETAKSEMVNDLNQMRDEVNKLAEEKVDISNYLAESETKKREAERSNQALEARFSDMFQKFNKEITQTNQKRNVLEQIILKKEKDLDEKDKSLNEKLSALEETERMLSLRQAEIDSFDDLLKTISDQKELFKNDLINLDKTASDRKNFNKDLKMETEFLQQKMNVIEKDINELLTTSASRINNNSERKQLVESEIKECELRLTDLNDDIKDTMNELVELKSSLGKIKLEHEEHRLNIVKYAAIKKKLDEEILKNKTLLNKYRQIREKIKIEQTTMSRLKEDGHESEKVTTGEQRTLSIQQKAKEIFKL